MNARGRIECGAAGAGQAFGLALCLALGLALTTVAPARAADAADGVWRVVSLAEMDLTPADDVTLDFADGRVAGRSGCNRYSGMVTLTALDPAAGTLALGPVMGSQMACPGRADRVEQAFLSALQSVDGYRIAPDGTLVLTSGDAPLIHARRD